MSDKRKIEPKPLPEDVEVKNLARKDDPSRREFIQTSAAAGAALALGISCGGNDDDDDDTGGAPQWEDVPLGQVTMVRAATPAESLARALVLTGALGFIQEGQSVLLKPNMTGPIPPPDTTSPELLTALIAECYAAGAGRVIVGERTFKPLRTVDSFSLPIYESGTKNMLDYITEAGAEFLPFDDEPWVEVHPAGAVDFQQPFLIPQAISEVDHFIDVPACKTHYIGIFTMTMKNLFGTLHPSSRDQVHASPLNDPDNTIRQQRMFAEMNLAFSPVFNVMDAGIVRTTGGPTPPGDTHVANIVMVGKDRVAMDAAGLALVRSLGSEPHIMDKPIWEQVQLAEAVKLGFGITAPEQVQIVQEGIEEIADIEANLYEV